MLELDKSTQPICIYHSVDLDGKCSAAIVYHALKKEVELYPYDYGQPIKWDRVRGREVIMVDVSFQPFDQMIRLMDEAKNLTWIDHHDTAINAYAECGQQGRDDVTSILEYGNNQGASACELTWRAYFGEIPPKELSANVVYLLGRYDVWDHSDAHTDYFQYGMRMEDNNPSDPVWEKLLVDGSESEFVRILDNGRAIFYYQQKQNTAAAKGCSFETVFHGHRVIACNVGGVNSTFFDSVYDCDKYAMMLTFQRTSRQTWKIGLYSDNSSVHVGNIAKQHGGGGHAGAAGFVCEELPFKY